MSAFTIAFQVPNLIRSLFADAALQPAFVPVFTEQLGAEELPRGLPPRLDPAAARDHGAGRDHRALRPRRAGRDAALRPGLRGRAPRPHGHPLPGPLPDPDPARDQRRRRRHPQQLRPLRRLRDLAAVLEPDDHRRAGPRSAAVRGPGPDLRLRDRRPRRHPGPAADPRLRPAQHPVQVRLELRLAQPATCGGCCC